jgi:Ig-like domain CHU_C associated
MRSAAKVISVTGRSARRASNQLQPKTTKPVAGGTTAQLIVAASLPATITYQWYRGISGDTANPVAGATGAVFTTPSLTQTTTYWVRVTNAAGTADSNAATVTVNPITDPYTLWQSAQFPIDAIHDPAISSPAADPDRDGLTNEAEYVFGTTPLTTETPPVPVISVTAGQPILTFVAQRAVGAGYSGRTRVYALESTTNPDTGPWDGVPGFISITGDEQTVSYAPPAGDSRRFFRLKVRLTP